MEKSEDLKKIRKNPGKIRKPDTFPGKKIIKSYAINKLSFNPLKFEETLENFGKNPETG